MNSSFNKQYTLNDPVKISALDFQISISDNITFGYDYNVESLHLEHVSAGDWYGGSVNFEGMVVLAANNYISLIFRQNNLLGLPTIMLHRPIIIIERIR